MGTPITGWDATHVNLGSVPKNEQGGGYITGTPDIQWTLADWAKFPGAVRIDQSPHITAIDYTADMFDVENGAITIAELPQLLPEAQAAFHAGTRPGQRWPGVYCSESLVTDVANELTAAGIQCPLGVADYNWSAAQAQEFIRESSGPYPIVWVQYDNTGGGGAYDLDYYEHEWLINVSTIPDPPIPPVILKDENMLHYSVTAPAGHSWTGTRTFLFTPGSAPVWIVDQQSETAIAKVLPVAMVTWNMHLQMGGV